LKVTENIKLADLTTFGIGGRGMCLYEPQKEAELLELQENLAEDWPRAIYVGGGSNLLFQDEFLKSPLIRLRGDFARISKEGNLLQAGAAVSLPRLASRAAREGLSGLEWAAGIPGSVGGALVTNAGCFDSKMSDLVVEVKLLNSEGKIETRPVDQFDFDYRSSDIKEDELILAVKLELKNQEPEEINKKQKEFFEKRRRTQPLEHSSAGCVFKNPSDVSAGELIDRAGLKGEKIDGVEVSEKHANFFINRGGARCADVLRLIERVRRRVFNIFEQKLELEITVINFNQ
jgi:UDP-N-acetylmuramate dehydrogenase